MAEESLPHSVQLSDHKILSTKARELDLGDGHGNATKIRLPAELRKAVSKSSAIIFPEANSRPIDGREFALVVVETPSANEPTRYCGAGVESKLYAIQIDGTSTSIAFSKLIQSCLKNIDLTSDGVEPSYRSVSWSAHPVGIRISWMYDENGKGSTHIFQYDNGKFVEAPSIHE